MFDRGFRRILLAPRFMLLWAIVLRTRRALDEVRNGKNVCWTNRYAYNILFILSLLERSNCILQMLFRYRYNLKPLH